MTSLPVVNVDDDRTALEKLKRCPSCNELNDPDARCRDECGAAFGAAFPETAEVTT